MLLLFCFFMIVVDGSCHEGGGSILRFSLALSIYTGKPFRIVNIRKNRSKYNDKSGLKKQHLASVFLAQKVCNAKVVGASIGSSVLEFYPGEIVSKNLEVDIGSAGSVVLALQSVFLPCLFSGKKFSFSISGGTDVAWSPGFDFFKEVFLPLFEDYAEFDCRLLRRGYYPKGGGKMYLRINSFKDSLLKPFDLVSLGRLISVKGVSSASMDLESVGFADEEADAVSALLYDYDVPIRIDRFYSEADSTGSGLLVYGVFESDKIFRSGIFRVAPKMSVSVSEEVVSYFKKLLEEDVPFDEFFADQVIPFLALLKGQIKTVPLKSHLSKHLLANVYVSELFLGRKIVFSSDGVISCV